MSLGVLNGIMIFIIGLVFGSFYNVVGYRVPNNMSIVFPASHCTNCNHKLKFYENVRNVKKGYQFSILSLNY